MRSNESPRHSGHGDIGRSLRGSRARRSARYGRRSHSALGLIAAIYLTLATIVAVGAAQLLHKHSGPPVLAAGVAAAVPTTPKYLVLFVLDGARPDYFGLTPLPHVDALRASGTQFTNAVSGILEAETPSGHATIATGSRPDKNGILGFDWANDDDRFSLFAPEKMPTVEQLIRDSGAPTIAGLYKKRFPEAKVVALSGHKYYAAAPLGGPDADAILYYQGDPKGRYVPVAVPGHVPPAGVLDAPGVISPTTHQPNGAEDRLATRLALSAVNKMQPRVLLINYPEFDWPLGHIDGGIEARNKVITDMQTFDSDLGKIEDAYRAAGILDQTLFAITADHGMMPISRFVPSTLIDNAITQAGTTAPDIASSSADYIWLADQSKAQTVAENILNTHDTGIDSAYYLTVTNGQPQYVAAGQGTGDAALANAHRYLLDALLNSHEPTVVVFGKEGASFSDPATKWKADHGGPTWESQHLPLILAGPGIAAGKIDDSPVQLEDVAPTVLTDMGVSSTGMSGHVLTDALLSSSASDQAGRQDEIGWLGPVLQALQDASNPRPRA